MLCSCVLHCSIVLANTCVFLFLLLTCTCNVQCACASGCLGNTGGPPRGSAGATEPAQDQPHAGGGGGLLQRLPGGLGEAGCWRVVVVNMV